MNLRQGHQLSPMPCTLGVLQEKEGGPTPLSKAAGSSSSLAGPRQCLSLGPTRSPSSAARPPYPPQGRRSGALLPGRVPLQPKGALQGEGQGAPRATASCSAWEKAPRRPLSALETFQQSPGPPQGRQPPNRPRLTNPHHSQKTWWSACRCQLPGIPDTWNLPTGVHECE